GHYCGTPRPNAAPHSSDADRARSTPERGGIPAPRRHVASGARRCAPPSGAAQCGGSACPRDAGEPPLHSAPAAARVAAPVAVRVAWLLVACLLPMTT